MTTINNTSTVTDYSGEPPIVTHSNTVTTIIRQAPTPPIIIRTFHYLLCRRCRCCCNRCGCNCCNYCCCR